jgi:hypothetical protein
VRTSDLLKARLGETVEIIIPPPKNATLSLQSLHDPTLRDQHIAEIQTHGRMAWQTGSGYNQRTKPLPADAGMFPFGVKLQILKYDIVSDISAGG